MDPEQYRIDSLLFPLDVNRHGSVPRMVQGLAPFEQIRFILDEIGELVEEQVCRWCDIGVLHADPYHRFAAQFSTTFIRRFGEERM